MASGISANGMGVTLVVCSVVGCGRMLNGELCAMPEGKPLCVAHAHAIHGFAKDEVLRKQEEKPRIKVCKCHGIEARRTTEILYPFDTGHLCSLTMHPCEVEELPAPNPEA